MAFVAVFMLGAVSARAEKELSNAKKSSGQSPAVYNDFQLKNKKQKNSGRSPAVKNDLAECNDRFLKVFSEMNTLAASVRADVSHSDWFSQFDEKSDFTLQIIYPEDAFLECRDEVSIDSDKLAEEYGPEEKDAKTLECRRRKVKADEKGLKRFKSLGECHAALVEISSDADQMVMVTKDLQKKSGLVVDPAEIKNLESAISNTAR